jgi:hypothetical protein
LELPAEAVTFCEFCWGVTKKLAMMPGRHWKEERKEGWANSQPWQKSLEIYKPRILKTFDIALPAF